MTAITSSPKAVVLASSESMNVSESTKIEDILRSQNEGTIAPYDNDTQKLEERRKCSVHNINPGEFRLSFDFS